MTDPKVPSWMRLVVPGQTTWKVGPECPYYAADGGYRTFYVPGELACFVDREMTAAQLRELADLIDSCQEASGHE